MRPVGIAASVVAALVAVAGCTVRPEPPTVSKTDLQADITAKLDETGRTPQSVTCRDDLEGIVGTTTRCEVVLGEADAFEPIVAVTDVEGSTVRYQMTPALSQQQVERSVEHLLVKNSGLIADSVTCDSGLEGKEGNKVRCAIVIAGEPVASTVTVTKVDGLMMSIGLERE